MNQACRLFLTTLALAVAGAVPAQMPPATPIEGSVETTTDAVILPDTLQGRVTVRNCESCESSTLQLDGHTQLNLAGRQVSLHEMASYLHKVSGRSLTIHYRLSDHVVSLISVVVQ
jgi:hypothetical protein